MEERRERPLRMETLTPQTCPYTVTVRRNPHRKARIPTTTDHHHHQQQPETSIRSFPIQDILSMDLPQTNPQNPCKSPAEVAPENLKVFLRIRPLLQSPDKRNGGARDRSSGGKNVWPRVQHGGNNKEKKKEKEKKTQKRDEICVRINEEDGRSVTLTPPLALQDLKRAKSEVFGGFSCVFPPESSQVLFFGYQFGWFDCFW